MLGLSISRNLTEVMALLMAKGMLECARWKLHPQAESSVSPVHVRMERIWQQSRHTEVLPVLLLRDLSNTTSTYLAILHQDLNSARQPRMFCESLRGAAIPLCCRLVLKVARKSSILLRSVVRILVAASDDEAEVEVARADSGQRWGAI